MAPHNGIAQSDIIKGDESVLDIIRKLTNEEEDLNSICLVDLGDVVKKYNKWKAMFPGVQPFYAVKCNDNMEVVRVLASLGTGFDCASQNEIKQVLSIGVDPSRIIYAHPCKQSSYLRFATEKGIKKMTFDNDYELEKIKEICPNAEIVLRITPPENSKSLYPLSMKYGCHISKVKPLLEKAKSLELNVIGVSFHVGSGCGDVTAFSGAIADCRKAFDIAETLGFKMHLLDIGGGFPGSADSDDVTIEEISEEYHKAMSEHFPASAGVRVIAEPGRFFVKTAFYVATNVIAKNKDEKSTPSHRYYLNDGTYGTFMFTGGEEDCPAPILLKKYSGPAFSSSLHGPAHVKDDELIEDCQLPELDVGDWLVFPQCGAYSTCIATSYHGMERPKLRYCGPKELSY